MPQEPDRLRVIIQLNEGWSNAVVKTDFVSHHIVSFQRALIPKADVATLSNKLRSERTSALHTRTRYIRVHANAPGEAGGVL